MKYLPFENITYHTKLDYKEILSRIGDNIEPLKRFKFTTFFENKIKPYEGTVNGNTFFIKRLIAYQNSFLPRVKGKLIDDENGIKVKVKMRLNPFISFFVGFWCLALGLASIIGLIVFISKDKFEPLVILALFSMTLFFYLLITLGFKYESNKTKKYLADLFESENPVIN